MRTAPWLALLLTACTVDSKGTDVADTVVGDSLPADTVPEDTVPDTTEDSEDTTEDSDDTTEDSDDSLAHSMEDTADTDLPAPTADTGSPTAHTGDTQGDSAPPTADTGPVFLDLDGDGIADAVDLCPTIPDPLQLDMDLDGLGDLCDPTDDRDQDGDGFSAPQGDCDDLDALRHPGRFEACNDQDEDCDGIVDEACVTLNDALRFTPVLEVSPAASGFFCQPPWTAGAGNTCPPGPPTLDLAPMDVSSWWVRRDDTGPSPGLPMAWLDLPSLQGPWMLRVRFEMLTADHPSHPSDGQVAGWVGVHHAEGSISGVRMIKGLGARMDYRDHPGPGLGRPRVELNQPTELILVKNLDRVEAYVDGHATGTLRLPMEDARQPGVALADSPVVGISLACVNCTGRVSHFELLAADTPMPPSPVDCVDLLWNGSFEEQTDDVPDFWGVRPTNDRNSIVLGASEFLDGLTGPELRSDAARSGAQGLYLPPSAPDVDPTELVQPIDLPPASCPTCDPMTADCGNRLTFEIYARADVPGAQLAVRLDDTPRTTPELDSVCAPLGGTVPTDCQPQGDVLLDVPVSSTFGAPLSVTFTGCGSSTDRFGTVANLFIANAGDAGLYLDEASLLPAGSIDTSCEPFRTDPLLESPSTDLPASHTISVGDTPVAAPLFTGTAPSSDTSEVWADSHALHLSLTTPDLPTDGAWSVKLFHGDRGRASVDLLLPTDGSWLRADGMTMDPSITLTPQGTGQRIEVELPWNSLALDAATPRIWRLQSAVYTDLGLRSTSSEIALAQPGAVVSGTALVFDDPPWSPGAEPAVAPAARPRAQQVTTRILQASALGDEPWLQMADLGLEAASIINPYQTLVPLYAEGAAARDIDLEIHTFQLHEVWRNGPIRDLFAVYAGFISDAYALHGQPSRWAIMDEPTVTPMSKCIREVSSATHPAYPGFRPLMVSAMDGAGCGPNLAAVCTSEQAAFVCQESLPLLIAELAAELRAVLPPEVALGMNMTPDGHTRWYEVITPAFDYMSATHNWGTDTRARDFLLTPWQQISTWAPATQLVGYNDIVGSTVNQRLRSHGEVLEFRAQSWNLVNLGAEEIREFVWPPSSRAALDTVVDLTAEFQSLAGIVPTGFIDPPPPVTPDILSARAYAAGDDVHLVLVNPTRRVVEARVSTAAWPDMMVSAWFGDHAPTQEENLVRATLPRHGVLRWVLSPAPPTP